MLRHWLAAINFQSYSGCGRPLPAIKLLVPLTLLMLVQSGYFDLEAAKTFSTNSMLDGI